MRLRDLAQWRYTLAQMCCEYNIPAPPSPHAARPVVATATIPLTSGGAWEPAMPAPGRLPGRLTMTRLRDTCHLMLRAG